MRKFLFTLLFLLSSEVAHAQALIAPELQDAEPVGSGRLTYLLWDVYDATLYAPDGKWQEGRPFALSLHYLRHLNGHAIADRSVQEMRKQGFQDEIKLAAWHAQMQAIFPDVESGTVLTGVYRPGQATTFYQGDAVIGTVKDPEFGKWFFGIWLSNRTSEPALRRQLLGMT